VYKTTLDGKILMTLKYPTETGQYATADEFKPTETAIGPNGDIYVADGYGKSLVIQYSPKGEYIRHFGGKGDKEENIRQAHGVCLDTRDKKNPTLLVTSREENALKRFTLDGKLLKTIKLPGAYVCRPVIRGQNVYASVLVSRMPWDSRSGFLVVLDKNDKLVSVPGGSEPVYQGGALQPLTQTANLFKHPHDVCVDNDDNLYVPNGTRTKRTRLNWNGCRGRWAEGKMCHISRIWHIFSLVIRGNAAKDHLSNRHNYDGRRTAENRKRIIPRGVRGTGAQRRERRAVRVLHGVIIPMNEYTT
jgi:hypothetical protein